jgi:hypothetical protein
VDFWLSTKDLPQPDNRVTLGSDGNVHILYKPSNPTAAKRPASAPWDFIVGPDPANFPRERKMISLS